MRIAITHHVWKEGETAAWFPEKFPIPEIETAVKGRYASLERRRPAWELFGNCCVFFAYKPAQDIFGRGIVPISFAFLQNCREPERCAARISPLLQKAGPTETFMDVSLPWEETDTQGLRWKGWHLLRLVALLIVIFAIYSWFNSADELSPENEVRSEQRTTPEEPSLENPANMLSVTPEQPEPSEPTDSTKPYEQLPDDLIDQLYLCPKAYAKQRLSGQITMSFRKWLEGENSREFCRSGWNRDAQYHKNAKNLSREQRKLLDEFFR